MATHVRRFVSIAFVVLAFGFVAATWHFSARVPVCYDPQSDLVPLAFSRDSSLLAAVEFSKSPSIWWPQPGRRIQIVRATDLMPVGAPIERPKADSGNSGLYNPELLMAEFSADGKMLAVLQKHRDIKRFDNELELWSRARIT